MKQETAHLKLKMAVQQLTSRAPDVPLSSLATALLVQESTNEAHWFVSPSTTLFKLETHFKHVTSRCSIKATHTHTPSNKVSIIKFALKSFQITYNSLIAPSHEGKIEKHGNKAIPPMLTLLHTWHFKTQQDTAKSTSGQLSTREKGGKKTDMRGDETARQESRKGQSLDNNQSSSPKTANSTTLRTPPAPPATPAGEATPDSPPIRA